MASNNKKPAVKTPAKKTQRHWIIDFMDEMRRDRKLSEREFSVECGFSEPWWNNWTRSRQSRIAQVKTVNRVLKKFGYQLAIVNAEGKVVACGSMRS